MPSNLRLTEPALDTRCEVSQLWRELPPPPPENIHKFRPGETEERRHLFNIRKSRLCTKKIKGHIKY